LTFRQIFAELVGTILRNPDSAKFAIIDEAFHYTNAGDKQEGQETTMNDMIKAWALGEVVIPAIGTIASGVVVSPPIL